jgi:hypothetical protein
VGERPRLEQIVRVEEQDVRAAGFGERPIPRRRLTAVLLSNQPDRGTERLGNRRRAVG